MTFKVPVLWIPEKNVLTLYIQFYLLKYVILKTNTYGTPGMNKTHHLDDDDKRGGKEARDEIKHL